MTRRWGTITALLAVIVAHTAMASEEAQHAEHAHQPAGIPWLSLLFSTVNFCLFGFILARYVWPHVRAWVSERHDHVVKALEDAATAKAEAEHMRTEWQQRLARLDAEIAAMRSQARQDAERERERILAAVQKTAEAIRRDAERAAAAEVRRAQEQLRAELVREAVRLAEATARTAWTADDQQRSVADFVKQVQQ